MKRLILVLSCLFCFLPSLQAQVYRDWAGEMFLYSQPNARAEAMGRGNAALTGSPFMSYYNPAASSFSEAFTAEFSHLNYFPSLMFPDHDENYDTYGVGVNFGTFGAFSLNYMRYSDGGVYVNRDPLGPESDGPHPISSEIYMANYSFPVLKSMSVGINANYFIQKFRNNYPDGPKGWYFDLGLLKKFQIQSGPASPQELSLGLSFMNLSNSKFPAVFSRNTYNFTLPSVMRFAAAYQIQPPDRFWDFRLFKGLLNAEYFDLLNSKYHTKFGLGTELTFLEMLKLRLGWYTEGLNNFSSTFVKSRVYQFTYGFGIEAPLRKIPGVRIPLNVKFDFASLPLPEYVNNDFRHKYNSPIYSFNISYGI